MAKYPLNEASGGGADITSEITVSWTCNPHLPMSEQVMNKNAFIDLVRECIECSFSGTGESKQQKSFTIDIGTVSITCGDSKMFLLKRK